MLVIFFTRKNLKSFQIYFQFQRFCTHSKKVFNNHLPPSHTFVSIFNVDEQSIFGIKIRFFQYSSNFLFTIWFLSFLDRLMGNYLTLKLFFTIHHVSFWENWIFFEHFKLKQIWDENQFWTSKIDFFQNFSKFQNMIHIMLVQSQVKMENLQLSGTIQFEKRYWGGKWFWNSMQNNVKFRSAYLYFKTIIGTMFWKFEELWKN